MILTLQKTELENLRKERQQMNAILVHYAAERDQLILENEKLRIDVNRWRDEYIALHLAAQKRNNKRERERQAISRSRRDLYSFGVLSLFFFRILFSNSETGNMATSWTRHT